MLTTLAEAIVTAFTVCPGRLLAVYVTGSHAGGYAVAGSDIDVKLVVDAIDERTLAPFRACTADLPRSFPGLDLNMLPIARLRDRPRHDLKRSARLLWGTDIRDQIPEETAEVFADNTARAVRCKFLPRFGERWAEGDGRLILATVSWMTASVLASRLGVVPCNKSQSFELYIHHHLPEDEMVAWTWEVLRGRWHSQLRPHENPQQCRAMETSFWTLAARFRT